MSTSRSARTMRNWINRPRIDQGRRVVIRRDNNAMSAWTSHRLIEQSQRANFQSRLVAIKQASDVCAFVGVHAESF